MFIRWDGLESVEVWEREGSWKQMRGNQQEHKMETRHRLCVFHHHLAPFPGNLFLNGSASLPGMGKQFSKSRAGE